MLFIITLKHNTENKYSGVLLLKRNNDDKNSIQEFNTHDISIDFIDALIEYSIKSKSTDTLVISEVIYDFAKEEGYNINVFDKRYGCEIIMPFNINTVDAMREYYASKKRKSTIPE